MPRMYEEFRYVVAQAVFRRSELPSCRAAELPSCRAAELPSCRADFGEVFGCQALNRFFRGLFALFFGLVVSGSSAFAQFTLPPGFFAQPTPPVDAYVWSGGAGSADWEDEDNWVGGDVPGDDVAHLLFGNAAQGSGPITVDFADANPWFSSLWFEGGRDVTLRAEEFEQLWLGYGLSSGDHLIGLFTGKPGQGDWPVSFNDLSAVHHSQVNIDAEIEIALGDRLVGAYDLIIENATRGGLRFGGESFGMGGLGSGDNLIIRGHGATNFAGRIDGNAGIIVRNAGWAVSWADGSGNFAGGQLVLSADNIGPVEGTGWYGGLIVDKGMAVIRAHGALGRTGNAEVRQGGALGFRSSHDGPGINYTHSQAILSLTGNGVWRSFGSRWTGALHNDGGDNFFDGAINFSGETGFGSVGGNLTLAGILTGTGNFVKWGGGVITLKNEDNSWVGQTLLRDGVLRISESEDALAGGFSGSSGGPNLTLVGGVLEIGVDTDFTRKLGAGDGQVQWLGDGGFSAYGGARKVTLGDDGTGTGSSLVWGSGSFVPTGSRLLLGSAYSDASLEFTNAIDLGSEVREVHVARGRDDSIYAELSGILSGEGGGLLKTGKGNLWLKETGNTYTGATIIRDGVLRGALPADSNLQFDGLPWQREGLTSGDPYWEGRWDFIYGPLQTQAEYPVYALDADFTRSVGKGSGQVHWTGSGGFAAYGADRTVMLNGSTDTVEWHWSRGADFVPEAHSLVFGSRDSDATVIWNTKLFGERTFFAVIEGAAPDRAAVRFTQQIKTGNFRLYGGGRADFILDEALSTTWSWAPDSPIYEATIGGAELWLRDQASLGKVEHIKILNGTLVLDNTAIYRSGRVPLGIYAGARYGKVFGEQMTLRLLGRTDSGETVDGIGYADILTGVFDVVNNRSDNYTELTIGDFRTAQFDIANPIHWHFINSDKTNGTYSESGNTARVRFEKPKDLIHGIYPWAIVNELDFATLRNNYLVPYEDYDTSDPSAWDAFTPNVNASPQSEGTMSNEKWLNSLRLIDGRSVNLASDASLTVRTLLSTGTGENFINGGSLTIHNELYRHTTVYTYAPLTITGNLNYTALYKTGDAALTLSGGTANGSGSRLYISNGMLILNNSDNSPAVAGRIDVLYGSTLRVDRDNQFSSDTHLVLLSPFTHERSTLLFNGENGRGLTQQFDTLSVQNGIIDFQGGEVGRPNILIVNQLLAWSSVDGGNTVLERGTIELWIKNWFEFEDHFLVRRGDVGWFAGMQLEVLPYITFEGYERGARFRDYDADFYEIVPFPEPTTYGAMLGAAGLGLVLLRKRKGRRAGAGRLAVGPRF